MTNFGAKISRKNNFAPTLNGHNSAIFEPILTLDQAKMISSARQISKAWEVLDIWTQNNPQVVGAYPGHYSTLIAKKFWA